MGTTIRHHFRALALLCGTVALLAAPAPAQAADLGCADNSANTTDLSAWIPAMLAATNAHRATVGAPALQLDPTLAKAATWKSRDMARRNYFAHDDQAGANGEPARSPWDRLTSCGWTSGGSRAENIAAGQQSGAAFIQAWINSPGHRANIENATYRYVGFGVASSTTSTYGTYATQMFASVAGPVAATPPTDPAPTTPTTPTTPTDDTSGGGDDDRTPLELVDLTVKAGASITRVRCRSALAVRGWCWYLTVRGTLASTSADAIAARPVVITRSLANGRLAAVGTRTSTATGGFTVRRALRPSANGTLTWLRRNARYVSISVAQVGVQPGTTALAIARVRL
jgi:uncharacterized protein YkwD